MPDYATINTARYVVDYTSNGGAHSMMFRYTNASNASIYGSELVYGLIDAMKTELPSDFAFTAARIYGAGETNSVPGPMPAAITGTQIPAKKYRANYYTFVARSAMGANCSIKLFGIERDVGGIAGNDFRENAIDNPTIAAGIAVMNGALGLVCIDNANAVFYQYVNFGVSSYWQRKMRKSA